MAVRYSPKSQKWISDTRDIYGKRQRRQFTRKGDAVQHEALEKTRNPRARNRPVRSTLTIAAWLEEWARLKAPDVAGSTARVHRVVIARLVPIIGHITLQAFSRADYRACTLKLSENGLAPSTISTTKSTLRAALRYAVAEDLISHDPTFDTSHGHMQQQKKVRSLTVDEGRRFARATMDLSPHDRSAVLLLLLAGLRVGEALALRPEDISKGSLRVEQSVSREDGIKDAKTRAGRRTVPLVPFLSNLIESREGAYVLWTETKRDGPRISTLKSRLYHLVKTTGKSCGLKVTPHDLRHTFAAQQIADGASLYAVSRWMGHANIGITVSVYGSWLPPEDTDSLDRYAERLVSTSVHEGGEAASEEKGDEGPNDAVSVT